MIDRSKIWKQKIITPTEEQAAMEEVFITRAVEETEACIKSYLSLPSSMGGHYINSDLFKEVFPEYSESMETRKKYAEVVHNSAAVLAGELFIRNASDESIKDCIFLTGVPGAGKTFFIQSLYVSGQIPEDVMIYEGDITNESIKEKFKLIIKNNKGVHIIVINPTLELAMENTISRALEIGRGASCTTIARIMSSLPTALSGIIRMCDGNLSLGIYNKTANDVIEFFVGLDNLHLLECGNYEEIKERLEALRLEILKRKGREDLLKKMC